jgi:hypothetical protein
MAPTKRGSSDQCSPDPGTAGSDSPELAVGRATGGPGRSPRKEASISSGSGRREGDEVSDSTSDFSGLSSQKVWGKIWKQFGQDVLSKEAHADRKLLIGLSSTGDVLAPEFMAPKDYADLIFKVRESLKDEGGSTQESAIEQLQKFLNTAAVPKKVETVQ